MRGELEPARRLSALWTDTVQETHLRCSTGLTLAVLVFAASTAASAQTAAGSIVKSIDKAGEIAATEVAPGTVVPDSPGVVVALGIQASVETPAPPSSQPEDAAPAAK